MIVNDPDTDEEIEIPPPMPMPGPCGICGWHPDQRHRVRDAQWERIIAGEDVTDVARDWAWTPEQMLALVA